MNTESDIPQDVMRATEEANQAFIAAKAFPVPTSPDEYEAAASQLRDIKKRWRDIETQRKRLKAPALEQAKRIDEFFSAPKGFCEQAEKALKQAMLTYDNEQRRLRQEAERKAAEAARKERERLEREAAKAEQAARAKREREEAKAREMEEQGRAAEAEAKRRAAEEAEAAKIQEAEMRRQAAQHVPTAPVVHMEQTKASGISTREVWSARVLDKMAVIKAVAEGKAPEDLININQAFANQLARALKSGMKVNGIEPVCDRTMAARAS